MVHLISVGIAVFSSSIFVIPAVIFWEYVVLKQRSLSKMITVMVFAFYLTAVFLVTGIPTAYSFHVNPEFNLIPLIDIVNNPPAYVRNTVLNIMLFVPLGFLLPALWKEYRSLRITVLAGFILSLFVEILQIFTFRLTDVDDLITNTAGAALGYYISRRYINRQSAPRISLKLSEDLENQKNSFGRLEPVILVGIVFLISFSLQPFLSGTLWDKVLSGPLWDAVK